MLKNILEKLTGITMFLLMISSYIIGLIQLVMTYAGIFYFFGIEAFWIKILVSPIAFVVSTTPLLGVATGIYGAVNSFHWEWWQAGLLFCWPLIFSFLGIGSFSIFGLLTLLKGIRKNEVLECFDRFIKETQLESIHDLCSQIKTVIRRRKDKSEFDDEGNILSPTRIAFGLASNIITYTLIYGGHYVYRGQLSMYGRSVLSAYKEILSKAVDQEIIQSQQAEEILDTLLEEIKSNG